MREIHYCKHIGEWVNAAKRRDIVTMANGATGRLVNVIISRGWCKIQFFSPHGKRFHGLVDLRDILMVGDRLAEPWEKYAFVEPEQGMRGKPLAPSEYVRFSALYEGRACEEPMAPRSA